MQMQKEKAEDESSKAISIDSKTYCKLGHFHLLLENYSKGISQFIFFHNIYYLRMGSELRSIKNALFSIIKIPQ